MKFHFMSDIHLEFGMPKPMMIQGENLILAGDITLLGRLEDRMNDAASRQIKDRTKLFFESMLENFDRVFYLTGNHESYGSNIDWEEDYIRKYIPSDVIYLNDSAYEFDDGRTVLLGGTLWTDMNKYDEVAMDWVQRGMNDFRIIRCGADDPFGGIFTPQDAYHRHQKTMGFFKDSMEKYKDKNIVIATHHAPTVQGINRFHSESEINPGYYSDLEPFIKENPQIKHWVFGHTHIQMKTKIGETMVASNAQGYPHEWSYIRFNPDTWFEVD